MTDCVKRKSDHHTRWVVMVCMGVGVYLLDGQHHDRSNDGHSDTGQHSKGTSSNQLIGIL